MTLAAFTKSIEIGSPEPSLPALLPLWIEARGTGDWHRAHDVLQDDHSADGAWVHAYLHRREGDVANAGYWYGRAGKPVAAGNLEAEWDAIAEALLAQS